MIVKLPRDHFYWVRWHDGETELPWLIFSFLWLIDGLHEVEFLHFNLNKTQWVLCVSSLLSDTILVHLWVTFRCISFIGHRLSTVCCNKTLFSRSLEKEKKIWYEKCDSLAVISVIQTFTRALSFFFYLVTSASVLDMQLGQLTPWVSWWSILSIQSQNSTPTWWCSWLRGNWFSNLDTVCIISWTFSDMMCIYPSNSTQNTT